MYRQGHSVLVPLIFATRDSLRHVIFMRPIGEWTFSEVSQCHVDGCLRWVRKWAAKSPWLLYYEGFLK